MSEREINHFSVDGGKVVLGFKAGVRATLSPQHLTELIGRAEEAGVPKRSDLETLLAAQRLASGTLSL